MGYIWAVNSVLRGKKCSFHAEKNWLNWVLWFLSKLTNIHNFKGRLWSLTSFWRYVIKPNPIINVGQYKVIWASHSNDVCSQENHHPHPKKWGTGKEPASQCSFPSLGTSNCGRKLSDAACHPGRSVHPTVWPLPTARAFYSLWRPRPQPGLCGNSLQGDTPLQGRTQRQDIHFVTRQPLWRVQRLSHHTFL